MAGGAGSSIGKGGMITKILAAKRAAGSGASTVIAWGREKDALLRLVAGESIGTLLVATTAKQAARKQWMADHLQLRGAVVIDDGAVLKLRDEGKSLLPIGVVEVLGESIRAATDTTPELSTSGGTSDGRFIADICPQVVEFGPINASIHKVNEHVAVADLEPLAAIYQETLTRLLKP